MKLKLVEDWKNGWKWISTNSMLLVASMLGAWQMLPEAMQAAVPMSVLAWVAVGILMLGTVGRFIDQGGSK